MEELLDVKEAGTLLGVSEQTVHRLVIRGEIPVVKIGDRTLFRPSDLESFVERSIETRGPERNKRRVARKPG